VRLHLLVGDAEWDDILGFVGELMLNPASSHCMPIDLHTTNKLAMEGGSDIE
jgi:hypothetical protein